MDEPDFARDKPYDELLGATLGVHYEILEAVSSGGAGDVYKVRHREMDRVYAAKVLKTAADPKSESVRRFKREAQILCKLRHPNIVAVHSFGFDEKYGPYLIMDLLDGQNLHALVRDEGPMPIERASKLLIGICEGMSSAHDIGVVHRDIKPSNVMIVGKGDQQRAIIIDFGAGKLLEGDQKLTQTDMIMGTPLYMAPEQCMAKGSDKRTDVYAMGCLMYEVLTGKPPFDGESSFEVMQKHLSEIPAPPSVANPTARIPTQIDDVVSLALQKDPQGRMDTFSKIKEALEIAIQRPTYGNLLAHAVETKRSSRSRKKIILALCVVLSALLAGALVFSVMQNAYHTTGAESASEVNLSQLIKAKNELCDQHRWTEARPYAQKIWELERTSGGNLRRREALYDLTRLEMELKNYGYASNYAEQLNKYVSIDEPEAYATAKLLQANVMMRMGRYKQAAVEFTRILPIAEKLERELQFRIYYDASSCASLRTPPDLEVALVLARAAAEIAPSKVFRARALSRTSTVLKDKGGEKNLRQSLQFALEALSTFGGPDVQLESKVALCYSALGDIANANKYKQIAANHVRSIPPRDEAEASAREESMEDLQKIP
jgi:serine/threonine protein kinase